MAEVTGSFEQALYESGRVSQYSRHHPAQHPRGCKNFVQSLQEGSQTRKVQGESAIPEAKLPIERVYLEPDAAKAFPPAIQALLNADLIIAGPGSLYTSILPNLLVKEIVAAIRASQAKKIYICNVATQPGETDHYTLADHVQAIDEHTNLTDTLADDYIALENRHLPKYSDPKNIYLNTFWSTITWVFQFQQLWITSRRSCQLIRLTKNIRLSKRMWWIKFTPGGTTLRSLPIK